MSTAKKELPPDTITGPDENGIKIYVTHRFNEKNQIVRTTRTVKVTKTIRRVKRAVLERRKWAKFGDCEGLPPGPEDGVTYLANDDITLDLSGKTVQQRQEEFKAALNVEKPAVIRCRNCGQTGHWTRSCKNEKVDIVDGELPNPAKEAKGVYVPPNKRAGARLKSDEYPTVRITNIPEDMTEVDLHDLFDPFGQTQRVFLARDYHTRESRGFAFISYIRKADGQKAIDNLNGHGYSNLILQVDWAKPREEE
jgi:translation initiation factor 3 subunit G